jgi:tetratricopeptide (TPR) repeat protein
MSASTTVTTETVQLNGIANLDGVSRVGPFRSKLSRYLNADWFRCLLLALVGALTRFPALQGERIWDDHYLARDNPFIKSPILILEAFRHYLFLDSFSAHYRPMQNISYMADYFFWNTNEFGFHLTNVLLHAGSGVLLYLLLRQLLRPLFLGPDSPTAPRLADPSLRWIFNGSFLVALLWSVHPVHSAAIDYISGRADSLAFFFASAGWLLFLRARGTAQPIRRGLLYFLAAFSGLLSLCSREIALVWVALFIVHVLFADKTGPLRARVYVVLCCVALTAGYFGLRQLPGHRLVAPLVDNWSGPVRASLMVRALGDYARLMIFPANLHMERTIFNPGAYRGNQGWRNEIGLEYLSILGLFALAILFWGCARQGRGQRMRIFGAIWFVAGYLPISNIVQLNATVAEHWLYLPSVGLLIFGAGWFAELGQRHWKLAAALALFASAGLSIRSYLRSTDWVNPETFFRRTIASGGISARTGLNLGQIYANRGDFKQAEKIFRKVLENTPDYPIAQNNLASVLSRQGKTKEAEDLFCAIEKNSVRTRKEFPCTWVGAVNIARMRHNAHDDKSALVILERAQEYYPEVWDLIALKSEIVRERQGPDAALRIVEDFARRNWWHHGAALALGRLYAQRGDARLANAALERASWLDVHDTEGLQLMVQMRLRENRLDEAFQLQRRCIARQPDEPSQYLLLSSILEKMGRANEARATLAQASGLRALVQNRAVPN